MFRGQDLGFKVRVDGLGFFVVGPWFRYKGFNKDLWYSFLGNVALVFRACRVPLFIVYGHTIEFIVERLHFKFFVSYCNVQA